MPTNRRPVLLAVSGADYPLSWIYIHHIQYALVLRERFLCHGTSSGHSGRVVGWLDRRDAVSDNETPYIVVKAAIID